MPVQTQNQTTPVGPVTLEEPKKVVDDEEGEKMWESESLPVAGQPVREVLPEIETTANIGVAAEPWTDVDRPQEQLEKEEAEEHALYMAEEQGMAAQAAEVETVESAVAREAAQATKDPVVVEVEETLASGIESLYATVPDTKKQMFKEAGEVLARQVASGLKKGALPRLKILKSVRSWLSMVPYTNKYFLEQESKIKLDQVIKLTESQEGG